MTFSIMIEKKLLDIVEESSCDTITKMLLKEKLLFYFELDKNKIEYPDSEYSSDYDDSKDEDSKK